MNDRSILTVVSFNFFEQYDRVFFLHSFKNIFFLSQSKVLENFSLNIEEGKVTVLIGPSGCGKSTILRLINQLLIPQQGEICISGQILNDTNILMVFV